MENNNKKEYLLENALKDFDINILAKGAEITLSENHDIKISEEILEDVLSGYYVGSISSDKNLPLKIICGVFEGIGRFGRAEVTVILDDINQEFVYSNCCCNGFNNNGFECEHVAALLIQYFIQKSGADVLADTEIERQLIKNTGIEHPLIPGIMRKTDRKLKSLITVKRHETPQSVLPLWLDNSMDAAKKITSKNTGMLSVECVVYPVDSVQLGVEIKAGPKKHLVIRDVQKLLNCYEDNSVYTFSNAISCPAGKNAYESESRKSMDFFLNLHKIDSVKNTTGLFSRTYYSDPHRTMVISGRDLDAFMQIHDGKNLSVPDKNKKNVSCQVNLSKSPRIIRLEKTEYGALLYIPEHFILGCGEEKIYMKDGDSIVGLPREHWEQRKLIADISGSAKGVYIQDKDLPGICMNLLPLLKNGQVQTEGMALETILPEVPKIEIYLDLPQDDLISCEVFARYPSGNKYNIFENKKDTKKRNKSEEQETAAAICPYFTAFDASNASLTLLCEDEESLFVFLSSTIPLLSKIGEVMVSDRINKLKFRSVGNLNVGVNVESGKLVVNLKSQTMDKDEIIDFLCKYDRKKKYTRLKNGVFISIDPKEGAMWEALSDTFKAYGKKNPEMMKVPMFRALYLEELLEDRDGVVFNAAENYRNLLRNLKDEKCRNYSVPKILKEILRPYQREGFRWIKMLKNNGFGGILADDMGLGKTLQALAFLLSEKTEGKKGDNLRTIIITPASLIYNWHREIQTFTPELTCCVVAGSAENRKKIIHEEGAEADVLITSYDLLKRDVAEYEGITFANEIIDEAQFVKNQNTQAAKSVRLIESGFRLALTGTPIENRLSELWSIFDYLMPGFLYTYSKFRQDIEIPVITDHNEETLEHVRKLVHPFILRRLKKDVLKDLPDKIEETVTVRMEGEQRKLYDAYAERLRLSLDKTSDEEFHENKIEILAEITKLRQICCGPEIFLDKYRGENAKKDACMELVRQSIDGGHKLLLFSQFTSVLDVLCGALKDEGIEYHRIDGSVNKEQRMKMVTSFETDEVPVFCVSLKAGGTGLNLTAADIVIHYDPWWNVAAQNQATDRTHRIGQKNTVTVYQILSEDTIEEHIVNLQQTKAKLVDDILEGEGISSILISKDELLGML